MPLDTEAPVDQAPIESQGGSEPTPDLSSPAPDATPSATGPDTGTQPDANTSSLATNQRSSPQTPPSPVAPQGVVPPAPQSHDWQKRYSDLQTHTQRMQEQYRAQQQQLEQWRGLDPQAARQAIELQRQQAQAAQLRQWHPRHPEFAQTEQRLGRVKSFQAAASAIQSDTSIPPEAKQALLANTARSMGVTNEDASLFQEHQQYVESSLNEFTRDPQSYIQNAARAEIQAQFAQYEQFQQMKSQTQGFLTDPQNAPLVQDKAETILWGMNHPARREVGLRLAQLEAENEKLQKQIGQQTESVSTAQAQSQALKGKAKVTRDLKVSPITKDPVKAGMDLGLKGVALMKHLEAARAASQE